VFAPRLTFTLLTIGLHGQQQQQKQQQQDEPGTTC